jgi:co-chaperonin GroES (HSP10)
LPTDDHNFSGEEEKTDDKVVIEPRFKPDTYNDQGGLLLEDRGKVISVGIDVKAFKPGDEVTFDHTSGQDVQLFGKVLKILKESEINPAQTSESG